MGGLVIKKVVVASIILDCYGMMLTVLSGVYTSTAGSGLSEVGSAISLDVLPCNAS